LARAVLNCWTAAVFVDFVVIFFVVELSMLPIGNKSALNGGQECPLRLPIMVLSLHKSSYYKLAGG
jgi:hypothetical protein